MWKPWTWARISNDRAIRLAREACVECSRRAVERADVALYLAASGDRPAYAVAE